jgi:hypothetical protein
MTNNNHWIYDLETYPNIFTFTTIRADGKNLVTMEVSDRKNETNRILDCLRYFIENDVSMVGFNNLGFDYQIIHHIISKARLAKRVKKEYKIDYNDVYNKAQEIIASMKEDVFGNIVRESDAIIKQIDLYKIHHFDNKARRTSLKMIEFNMCSENIEDIPFPLRDLTDNEKDVLVMYNKHDVKETLKFYNKSIGAINFREELTQRFGINCTNFNDTKVGKEYFIQTLEQSIPGSCYTQTSHGRKMRQSKRKKINIKECLFDYYSFKRSEFVAVYNWFKKQTITETKGVFGDIEEHLLDDVAKYAELTERRIRFKDKPTLKEIENFKKEHPYGCIEEIELKATEYLLDKNGNFVMEYPDGDITKKPKKVRVNKKSYWGVYYAAETLNVVVDGFRFDFGTGGIHGSIESSVVREDDEYMIIDADVSSMYPNIAISNRIYPEHLSDKFCDIYENVYNERKKYPKGSPENGLFKLALNGVYGDSNNQYSPFYDPKYTMSVTINGQLSLCLLYDRLLTIPDIQIIQINTDGLTVKIKRAFKQQYDDICNQWQKEVKLSLEFAEYSAMFIRDVNNYVALYTNSKVKRKGAYEYEGLGWWQNHSALIIPMAVEAAMVYGKDMEAFILSHENKWDFMLRTKVPRDSRLVLFMDDGTEIPQQNICRYYPSKNGGQLVKIMPPLEGSDTERRIGIDKEYKVKTANNILDFTWDIDYSYYINQAQKLLIETTT